MENDIVTNIYLRLIFGSWCIIIGLIALKLYYNRHKNNKWSLFYKKIFEKDYQNETKVYSDKSILYLQERLALILGWMSIIGGIIAICFGFKKHL